MKNYFKDLLQDIKPKNKTDLYMIILFIVVWVTNYFIIINV
jgi:hypothetical protein